jgi:hypothetical protein
LACFSLALLSSESLSEELLELLKELEVTSES